MVKHRRIDKAGTERGDTDLGRRQLGTKGQGKPDQGEFAGLVTDFRAGTSPNALQTFRIWLSLCALSAGSNSLTS